MRVQGEGFKFFVDGESKTVEETKSLIHDNMTITIKGLDVFYYSPKKETKTEKLLKEAEEHQKQNGGVLQGMEFPFDSSSLASKEIYNQILDISHSLEKQFIDFNFRLPKENILGDGFFNKIKETECQNENAKKETEGKLFYELDFKFIKQMAERMQSNKDNSKYDLWNWKRPMTPKGIEELKQATLRHLIEILEGNYEDDGREFGHLEAVSNNIMMINYQLNNE